MKSRRRCFLNILGPLTLVFALALVPALAGSAGAATEDAALFYDELSQHGQWVDYQNYGPVWHPTEVDQDWRPYMNGRWTPSKEGYVFETQEPWGWATYHYGNWMPTENYGWVWAPGRTWYPSTVAWRTSPENAPVDTSYVGWAPIPPPNYAPTAGYYPSGGYAPGTPLLNALTAPFWLFAQASRFLLGFGQPFAPGYSYYGCGCLAPPTYIPTFFPRTVIVANYYTPTYYPRHFFGRGFTAYSWGPPVPYIARVTGMNQAIIVNRINAVNIARFHNVAPPPALINRHGYIRDIVPPALVHGGPLPPPQRVTDIRMAQANINKPNMIMAPKQVPPITAAIPKAQPLPPQAGRGMVGAGLPSRAIQPLTPQMHQQIQNLPPQQRITPAAPPARPMAQPGAPTAPGAVRPGQPPAPGVAPPGGPQAPGAMRPAVPPAPGAVRPGGPPPPTAGRPGGPPAPGTFGPAPAPAPGAVRPGAPRPAGPAAPSAARPGVPPQPRAVRPGGPTTPAPGAFGPQGPAPQQPQMRPPGPTPQMRPQGPPQPQMRPQGPPQTQPRPQGPQPQMMRQGPQPQVRPQGPPQQQLRPQGPPQQQMRAPQAPQRQPQPQRPQPQPQQQKKKEEPPPR
jgi:hypothetical protein